MQHNAEPQSVHDTEQTRSAFLAAALWAELCAFGVIFDEQSCCCSVNYPLNSPTTVDCAHQQDTRPPGAAGCTAGPGGWATERQAQRPHKASGKSTGPSTIGNVHDVRVRLPFVFLLLV